MKRGQIWIETVIYTLIGLSLIAVVLAIVTPKINEFRDRTVIEQTIDSLGILDSKIREAAEEGPGNVRTVEFTMKRGTLTFDPQNEEIYFILDDSRALFSEPGIPITIGRVNVTTFEGTTEDNRIELKLNYLNYDITFRGDNNQDATFSSASTPYRYKIQNNGIVGGTTQIDITEIS